MHTTRWLTWAALSLAMTTALSGCGVKGPLYLPGTPEGDSAIAEDLRAERDRRRELEIENRRLRQRIQALERGRESGEPQG
jgi:predicted small lipoprotein YifL